MGVIVAVSMQMKTQISRIRIAEIEVISIAGEVVENGNVEVVEIVVIAAVVTVVKVVILREMDAEGEILEIMKEEIGPNVQVVGEVTNVALVVAAEIEVAVTVAAMIDHCQKGCGSWLERTLAREVEMATMDSSLEVEGTSEAAVT